ncbi:hypothetical protein SARC_17827, partial [Sphaeroforma arctica JP610]
MDHEADMHIDGDNVSRIDCDNESNSELKVDRECESFRVSKATSGDEGGFGDTRYVS